MTRHVLAWATAVAMLLGGVRGVAANDSGESPPGTPRNPADWYPTPCPAPISGCCEGNAGGDYASNALAGDGDIDRANARIIPAKQRGGAGRNTEAAEAITTIITIEPSATASVVALEYEVPKGWTVTSISDAGQWDPSHRKVKRGPFFHDLERSVTFTARPAIGQGTTGNAAGATGDARVTPTATRRRTRGDAATSAPSKDDLPTGGFTGTVCFNGLNRPMAVE